MPVVDASADRPKLLAARQNSARLRQFGAWKARSLQTYTRRMGSDAAETGGPRSEATPLLEGTPYRYVRPLGQGGMAQVVEAEHRELGTRLVVKILHDQFDDSPEQ